MPQPTIGDVAAAAFAVTVVSLPHFAPLELALSGAVGNMPLAHRPIARTPSRVVA